MNIPGMKLAVLIWPERNTKHDIQLNSGIQSGAPPIEWTPERNFKSLEISSH